MINKIKSYWHSIPSGAGVFIFYLIHWICGRIYVLADSYWNVKIFHTIGIHFEFTCFIFYHNYKLSSCKKSDLVFSQWYLLCQIISALFFCFVQLPMDHETRKVVFDAGNKASGAFAIFQSLGIFQDFFVPVYGSLAYLFWKKSYRLEMTNG